MSVGRHRVESITRAAALAAGLVLFAAGAARGGEIPPGEALWAGVLQEYVRDGAVDYDGLVLDRWHLRAYVQWLAVPLPPESSPLDSIARGINAYNAFTVDLVARAQRERKDPVGSVRSIQGAWTARRWDLGGATVSLDQIEHELLRKKFREPRIHFALVCASRSCPALRRTPYLGSRLDAQLDSAGREFVLDPSRNDFTPREGKIRISRIFEWYGKDFAGVHRDSTLERLYGPVDGAVLACVSRYLAPETAAALRERRVKIEYVPYDWSLNRAESE
jgi:hypothetical protein